MRRSGRLSGAEAGPSLDEDEIFRRVGLLDRGDFFAAAPTRRRRVGVDPARLAALRAQLVAEVDGPEAGAAAAAAAAADAPFDSGLGVRIQGGRVYDSKYGVTCHWCRQKTLEDHVECTAPACGGGRKLPVSFCRMCLRNRHGEDLGRALASGAWVCPPCRRACGEGCASCCNCGPCRKRAGLAPTRQLIKTARAAGFADVHDYLVHAASGAGAAEVAARKAAAPWGAWLAAPYEPAAEAEEAEAEEEEAAVATPAQAASGGALSAEASTSSDEESEEEFDSDLDADAATESEAEEEEEEAAADAEASEEEGEEEEAVHVFASAPAMRGGAVAEKGGLSRKQRMMRKLGLAGAV